MRQEYLIRIFARTRSEAQTPNSRPILSGLYAELVKLRLQRSAFQPQPRGCAVWPSELAVAIPKSAKNAFAFFMAETEVFAPITLGNGGLQFGER
jgi:hypothetical protein